MMIASLLAKITSAAARPQSDALKAGMVVIVPQGAWHRFEAPDEMSLMTTTPQPTHHVTFAIDDPHTLE